MAYNTTLSVAKVLNATIRDTNPANAIPFVLDQLEETVALVINTTDQAVTVSTQYATDGINFVAVGTTANVAAGGTLVCNQYDQTLTGLKLFSGYLRVVATAAVAPTLGNVSVTLQGMLS